MVSPGRARSSAAPMVVIASGPTVQLRGERTTPNRSFSPDVECSQYGRAARNTADAASTPRRNQVQREE